MIYLLPLSKLLTWLAVSYGVIIAIIISFVPGSPLENAAVALGGWTTLHIVIIFFMSIGWKKIWQYIPWLEKLVYPDLNGEWDITIHWQNNNNESGVAQGKATIKFNFYKISIEVATKDSDSFTICARPSRNSESGSPSLDYIFHVIPKYNQVDNNRPQEPYIGAALLHVDKDCQNTLKGNYFTDIRTRGHLILKRKLSE